MNLKRDIHSRIIQYLILIWSEPPNTDIPHEDKKDLYRIWEKHIKAVAKKMVDIPHDSGMVKTNNNFPDSLTLANKKYPIPAIDLEDTTLDITPLLTCLDIFVSPKQKFSVNMRNIFKETTISFKSAKQARRWLSGPDFRYWSQQLNFAVWCATSGCGISLRESEKYPAVVYSFVKFHVYFTVRRILYELGVPLPDDSAFNETDNPYNKVVYNRLCNKFNLTNPDFKWKGGRNHGLADIFLDYGYGKGGRFHNVHVTRGYDIEANTWPDK